jgi:hypothetical protein
MTPQDSGSAADDAAAARLHNLDALGKHARMPASVRASRFNALQTGGADKPKHPLDPKMRDQAAKDLAGVIRGLFVEDGIVHELKSLLNGLGREAIDALRALLSPAERTFLEENLLNTR